MKSSPSKNFKLIILFLCLIKLALSTNDEAVTETNTEETTKELNDIVDVTTLRLELINPIVDVTTLKLDLINPIEATTSLKIDTDALLETTTISATEEETTLEFKENPIEITTLQVDADAIVEETTTNTAGIEEETTLDLKENTDETTTPCQDITTQSAAELHNYALKQMTFILDHILETSYDLVAQVLQESDNSFDQRDKLKRYAEILHRLLHDSSEEIPDEESSYNLVLKKLTFLQGKGTRYLHKYLPEEWLLTHNKMKQETSTWLDKVAEQMRMEFNAIVSEVDDPVQFQYFNESFDDIPRANEIQQKLAILVDLMKIAINKKQITFMDLYMQQS